ncbi:MAG: hypothetical protein SH850_19095 [Planctomycetaceae bacterium]|nr:hypothetical protein [Planctomycetaceae bacterium]
MPEKPPLDIVDRRYQQVTFLAWIVIYVWSIVRAIPSVLEQRGDPMFLALLAFVFMFLAFCAAMVTVIVFAIPLRIILNLVLADRRRPHLSETVFLTIVLVVIGGYLYEVHREKSRLAPPKGVTTLSGFVDAMPSPRRLNLVHKDSRDYIVWTGDSSGPWDVPSGPACYLFDHTGKLVDWQPVTGDGGRVEEFIATATKHGEVSLDQAIELTRRPPNSVGHF